jgi:general stress protein 26
MTRSSIFKAHTGALHPMFDVDVEKAGEEWFKSNEKLEKAKAAKERAQSYTFSAHTSALHPMFDVDVEKAAEEWFKSNAKLEKANVAKELKKKIKATRGGFK